MTLTLTATPEEERAMIANLAERVPEGMLRSAVKTLRLEDGHLTGKIMGVRVDAVLKVDSG